MRPERPLALTGGRVLPPDRDETVPGTVTCLGDRILSVDTSLDTWVDDPGDGPDAHLEGATVVDVSGAWVLPGIVDLHGDGFERCLMPRPGVSFDVDLALADNDAQLLAAGITTSYLSATDSWEPGLRSRRTLLELVDGLARRTGGPDVRLHVRHERCNTEDLDRLLSLLTAGHIDLLSYNDHTEDDAERISMTQLQRTGLDSTAMGRLQIERAGQRSAGAEQERELATVAEAVGCPTASHDPAGLDDLERDLALAIAIAEFPISIELAMSYRAAGIPVLLGAPNLVRGGSHLGNLSVAEALRLGAVDILCSDYHYPSLLQAPFAAVAQALLAFGPAWSLVSEAPARAAGLTDRGRLEAGGRADLVVVTPPRPGSTDPAVVDQVVVGGRIAGLRP